MRSNGWRLSALAVAALTALAVTACGGSSNGGSSTSSGAPVAGKKGGTLKVVFGGDFEHIDPGESYYLPDYEMVFATNRPLYSFEPSNVDKASPDLAASEPVLSNGGRTVTIKLKPNIKYSPPVNRAATSQDVKYAIERGFTAGVPNGYAGTYFSVIKGAPAPGQKTVPDITGIETPDPQTVVFKLSQASGAFIGALSLPTTAPVPEDYAKKYDSKTPSAYGSYQVATGPYMIQADKSGKITYQVGKSMTLVRNPNWNPSTDFRPAYVSQIDFSMGNEDTTVASRQILDGQSSVSGDVVPDPPTIKRALQHQKGQIVFVPLGNRYVTLTTNIKPLDNINVRKAIVAATDRNALRLTRGGPVIGDIATHYLTPGQPGFDQAGGMKGPPLDFLANPDGNPQLAAQYMKKAGYPSGKYTGNQTLLMVGDDSSSGPGAKTAEVFQSQLQKLGFKLNFRQVPNETMYSRYCNVPKANVAICPNIAWGPDFADGQVMLDPTFNGATIVPENNVNQSLLNNPQVNAKLDAARKLVSPAQRADAYGAIDKQITALAPAVPWLWDKQANISSANVQGVTAKWNAAWDLSFTSIKQ